MITVGIIGLGRFGQLLQDILSNYFTVKSYDAQQDKSALHEVLKQENIFIATPIREFESIIKEIAPHIRSDATVIDVCSVKVYPVKIMQTYLPSTVDIIATHPMFGPDSFQTAHEKKIMLANIRDLQHRYLFWCNFFDSQNIRVIEMTPEQHDAYMAQSQSITHLIGRALERLPAESTPLNTTGYSQLLSIMQQTCNDSWDLFLDLERFNPYAKAITHKLLQSIQYLINEIEKST